MHKPNHVLNSPRREWKSDVLWGAALFCLALFMYAPILSSYFLVDDFFVLYFSKIASLHDRLRYVLFDNPSARGSRFLFHLMRYAEGGFFADNVWAWNLLSVLIHACSAFLLVCWLRSIGIGRSASLLGGALFLVWPIAPAAVVRQTGDWMASPFLLLMLLFYDRYRRGGRLLPLALACSFFAMALLIRETVAVASIVLVLMESAVYRDVARRDRAWLVVAGTLTMSFLLAANFLWPLPFPMAYPYVIAQEAAPLGPVTAVMNLFWNSFRLFVPFNRHEVAFLPQRISLLACLSVLLAMGVWRVHKVRKRVLLFAMGFSLAFLCPSLIIFIGSDLHYSHLLYLPSIGLCAGVAALFSAACESGHARRLLCLAAAATLLVFASWGSCMNIVAWMKAGSVARNTVQETRLWVRSVQRLAPGKKLKVWFENPPLRIEGASVYGPQTGLELDLPRRMGLLKPLARPFPREKWLEAILFDHLGTLAVQAVTPGCLFLNERLGDSGADVRCYQWMFQKENFDLVLRWNEATGAVERQ